MEAFTEMLNGLVAHPTACFLVLALIALAFIYRAREVDRAAHGVLVQKLNDDHKATIEKVIPVADKLGDAAIAVEKAVATLERLMEKH